MQFSKKILPNGMRVITIPMKDNPTVTVLVMVETGSEYENKDNKGVSHFLEHMCFKGTTKRPTTFDISAELDGLGSQYNAFTSQEYTGYYAKSRANNFEKILDVVSDVYQDPLFDPKEIEKEKGVIVEEIRMYEDMPHRHVHDLFMSLLYGDQPAGWNVAGTEAIVNKLTREDFIQYRKKHYVAEATTVVVSGSFDEDAILEKIQKTFSSIQSGKKEAKEKTVEKQEKPELQIQFKETDQAHLILGVRSFNTYSELTPTVDVLSSILGGGMSSRLFRKLRNEMGIGYRVSAFNDTYADHGYFAVTTGVDKKRVTEAITAILGEMKRLCDEPVSQDELSRVKEHLIGNLYLELESSDALAQFYGSQEVMKKRILLPEEVVKEIQSVTVESLQKIANEIFKNENLNCAIIGPFKDQEKFLKLLSF